MIASPYFESGYDIAYASVNYYGGDEEDAGHFSCISYTTDDKVCPSLGKTKVGDILFIMD